LQEHQAKALFAKHAIPIPRGRVASTAEEAHCIATDLQSGVVVKAQVLVGGRGKAGGVRFAPTPAAAREAADDILSIQVRGIDVRRVLVEQAIDIKQEIYLGLAIDRGMRCAVMMASAEGGVDIEQVAHNDPQAIKRALLDPLSTLTPIQIKTLAESIGLPNNLHGAFSAIACALYKVFHTHDALLAEINPLVITSKDALLALDGKIVIDDNALFRHPDLEQMRDASEETEAEGEARLAGLSYVYLGGEIGCVVNGAGLAMAAMDVIELFGGRPANFLDVGGGANAEQVAEAMRLVIDTQGVKAVLLNIFGGITHCDEVARGIVTALAQIRNDIPLVVRLIGTNEDEGRTILNQSGYRLRVATTLAEAAQKVVALARGEEGSQG
jgi:succinyl-CoA synthetase beta subunit